MTKFLTNIYAKCADDMQEIFRLVGLKAVIEKDACDVFHRPLPECNAVWYDSDKNDPASVEKFFYAYARWQMTLEQIYKNNGVPEELFAKKRLYRGCEKDYFPEYKINYQISP